MVLGEDRTAVTAIESAGSEERCHDAWGGVLTIRHAVPFTWVKRYGLGEGVDGMNLLTDPVGFGFQDVAAPRARVYYPSASDPNGVRDGPPLTPPRNRPYPLVVFIHGDRRFKTELCPSDDTVDYKRWHAVLRLLPRCGLVVLSLDVAGVLTGEPTRAAAVAVDALNWARGDWEHRAILQGPPVILDSHDSPPPLPNVGAIGHSWGAQVAARLAAERHVRCVAAVMGSWIQATSQDLRSARVPALFIAGLDDAGEAGPDHQPFCRQQPPVHQASLLDTGHWDLSEIRLCDEPRPPRQKGYRAIASEMLTLFLHRYLYHDSLVAPSLFGRSGGRPSVKPSLTREGGCAVAVRWRDPFTENAQLREVRFGSWPRNTRAWPDC
jgi:hypothetical protein